MIKVSVIVPVYNAEKYLDTCFSTLVNQTLDEIQIIAVNDGSTDHSQEILEGYQNKYPQKVLVLRQENGGQASARNLALRYAQGEFIGCVDADDFVDLSMFESMYAAAKESGSDVVACASYTVKDGEKKFTDFGDYEDTNRLFIDAWVSPCNKIVKREIYERSGVTFPEGYIYEDTGWFAMLIPYITKIKTIHAPPLYYRMINENSTMTSKQSSRTGQIFPVMNGVVDFYHQKGLFEKYHSELEYFYTRILLLSSLRRIAKIDDRPIRNELKKRTLAELNSHFPDYKKNQYLSGWRGLYIKRMSPFTASVFIFACRLLRRCHIGI